MLPLLVTEGKDVLENHRRSREPSSGSHLPPRSRSGSSSKKKTRGKIRKFPKRAKRGTGWGSQHNGYKEMVCLNKRRKIGGGGGEKELSARENHQSTSKWFLDILPNQKGQTMRDSADGGGKTTSGEGENLGTHPVGWPPQGGQ